MNNIKNFVNKYKYKILLVFILIFATSFIGVWSIISEDYDRNNKYILFLKKVIPSKFARQLRDTVFVIPDLKERNRVLNIQVKKYEQKIQGEKFNQETVISKKNKKKYFLKEFFLPFERLDLRLGYNGEENSTRAHYLEIIGDKVIVISGKGKTLFFEKKNINTKELNQIEIPNNINSILNKNDYKITGIRDLYIDDGKVYISLIFKSSNKYSINIYRANLNFKKLEFKIFFKTNEYWEAYNVFSGGRISKYKENKILFSIGYAHINGAAQKSDNLLGKIVSIDKNTAEHRIISIGHRNPQGLFYVKNLNLIINTEHGPKGGDEINLNFQNSDKVPNYGWDISSYGTPYVGKDHYKKSHSKYGFVEPFKYFVPSIGISEIYYLSDKLSLDKKNYLYTTSLRAKSIYVLEINKKFNEIISEDRIYFRQRIRDIDYDKEKGLFFLIFENVPSIGILKL